MSNTTIQLRKSGQTGNTPADLAHGELAINYADGKLFYKNGVGIKSIENQQTFSTINANSSLILATSPTDILNIVPGNNITISSNVTSKTITIESTASGDGALAQAAYNTANIGVDLASAAFDEANTKTDFFYQNTTPAVANTGDIWINSDTGFEYTNFGNVSNPTWAETGPTAASSNTIHTNTFAQAAFDKANNAIPLTGSSSITGNLTPATTNTYYLGSDTNRWHSLYVGPGSIDLGGLILSNTNNNLTISHQGQVVQPEGIDTYARAAANSGLELAGAAYEEANTQNAINQTQNTNITNVNTLAGAAYNTANLKFDTTGGTITGNVTIQNNLVIEGNLTTLGNSTVINTSSLQVEDPLIFLANNNIQSDAVDIGMVGHYYDGANTAHTGVFRDPILKEWIVFEGYTPQVESNNLIDISNPSFAYANLYADVVKSNLISTYATVNGLNVSSTMTSAFNSANAGVTLANSAFNKANNALANTSGAIFGGDLTISGSGAIGTTSNLFRQFTISRPSEARNEQLEFRVEGGITTGNYGGILWTQGAPSTNLASIRVNYNSSGQPDMAFNLRNESNVLFLKNGGNVGLNTNNPLYKLHVEGSGYFNGVLTADGSGITAINASNITTGTLSTSRIQNSQILKYRGTYTQENGTNEMLTGIDNLWSSDGSNDGYWTIVRIGYSTVCLAFNGGGSAGSFQWAWSYNSASYRRNRTDNASWSAWRQVD